MTAYRQKFRELEQGIENVSDTIFNTDDPDVRETLEKRLQKALADEKAVTKTIQELESEQETAKVKADQFRATMDTAKEVYQLLQDTGDKQEAIDLRLRLRAELQKLVERIEVYPLQEPYQSEPVEVDPGIYKVFHSRGIDKIRIRFHGGDRRVLYLKRHIDTD